MIEFQTVPTTGARRVVDGNGAGTVFATNYVFLDADSLVVTLVQTDGTEVLQVLGTDYTVTGGEGNVGSVTMTTAPASGESLVIEREEEYLQETDLIGADPFNAVTIETQFDKVVMLIQQLLDLSKRAIQAPITRDPDADPLTLPEPVDGNILVGRSDLTGWDNADPDDVFVTTDFDVLGLPVSIANGGTGQTKAANMAKADYLATTGSGGTYVATSSPAATGLVDGMFVRIEANHTSTGSMTFNLDGLGAKSILDGNGQTLPNGGIQSGGIYGLSYDATLDAWFLMGHSKPYVSKLTAVRVYTSSTVWTKPSDIDYVEVEVVGGGGGSGGTGETGTREAAASGGGGGGEYGFARIDGGSLSATETVTVGSGGAAGAADAAGGAGTASAFGSLVTAAAGAGGAVGDDVGNGAVRTDVSAGGAGGTGGTGGDFHVPGEAGQAGVIVTDESSGSNHTAVVTQFGRGGRAGGAIGGPGGAAGNQAVGSQPAGYGGGGGGSTATASESARTGAAGAKGAVIVREYTFEFV